MTPYDVLLSSDHVVKPRSDLMWTQRDKKIKSTDTGMWLFPNLLFGERCTHFLRSGVRRSVTRRPRRLPEHAGSWPSSERHGPSSDPESVWHGSTWDIQKTRQLSTLVCERWWWWWWWGEHTARELTSSSSHPSWASSRVQDSHE